MYYFRGLVLLLSTCLVATEDDEHQAELRRQIASLDERLKTMRPEDITLDFQREVANTFHQLPEDDYGEAVERFDEKVRKMHNGNKKILNKIGISPEPPKSPRSELKRNEELPIHKAGNTVQKHESQSQGVTALDLKPKSISEAPPVPQEPAKTKTSFSMAPVPAPASKPNSHSVAPPVLQEPVKPKISLPLASVLAPAPKQNSRFDASPVPQEPAKTKFSIPLSPVPAPAPKPNSHSVALPVLQEPAKTKIVFPMYGVPAPAPKPNSHSVAPTVAQEPVKPKISLPLASVLAPAPKQNSHFDASPVPQEPAKTKFSIPLSPVSAPAPKQNSHFDASPVPQEPAKTKISIPLSPVPASAPKQNSHFDAPTVSQEPSPMPKSQSQEPQTFERPFGFKLQKPNLSFLSLGQTQNPPTPKPSSYRRVPLIKPPDQFIVQKNGQKPTSGNNDQDNGTTQEALKMKAHPLRFKNG